MKYNMLYITGILSVLSLLYGCFIMNTKTNAFPSHPEITGTFGVTIDATSGEILFGKNERDISSPASLAKMMTTLLLLEQVKPNEQITITQHAIDTESGTSKITLHAGERLTRDEAIKLMLTISVDQVAESVAEHIAGSKEQFVLLMNERAKQLGATNTSFQNASGADTLGQHITAYDFALITKNAITHPEVLHAMSQVTTTVHTSLQQKEITNDGRKELFHDPYAIASKSGRTDASGYTLVAIEEKNGRKIITVVLKSDKEHLYKDAELMAHFTLR
ncbi:D-alanyl-D-alanine carboxypeptidase family protein [Ectobacillus sp. sgz5001026]|uniref:D-alanyl-D-alanine carboxypeptidase family protein n=1 Tax=Ectobacillus sp. sgz5001026 TaxID=3242473 RepID=UPI0036D41540